MSQTSKEAKPTESIINTNGIKMVGVKLGKKATTKKYRVPESGSKLEEKDFVPSGEPSVTGKEKTPKSKYVEKK